MKYKIGDKISFLNEKGTGIVVNILNNFRVLVQNEEGFEISVSTDEIVPLADKTVYKIDTRKIKEKDEEEVKPPKLLLNEIWEVDLHLRELLDVGREMTDHEKLQYQLKHFHKCMNAAMGHRIKKIIFIHGIGKGTLKQEIIHALKNYERAKHYSAPFKKYGFGALTVEIY